MTAPRQILPGTTYLVTHRCLQRQFLLKPSETTNQIFLYLLAEAARRNGIEVHGYCVLSNHYHLVLTDPDARLPAFHQFLDAFVARAVNSALGRSGEFWARRGYSAVVLPTPEAIVDKVAYILANPAAAGLVRTGAVWPGLCSSPAQIGEVIEIRRPEHFFDPKGGMPEIATLELTVPPGFESAEAFRQQVAAAVEEREAEAARKHRGNFMGVRAVLAQEPTAQPSVAETTGALNPRVASKDKWKRIEVLGRVAEFVRAYREAWAARTAGDLNALFPCGTYLLRVLHGVPCVGFG